MALSRGTMDLSAVCDCVFFSDHTHIFYKTDPRVPTITTVAPEETLDPWLAKECQSKYLIRL